MCGCSHTVDDEWWQNVVENVNIVQHSVDGGSGFLVITKKKKTFLEFEEFLPVLMN